VLPPPILATISPGAGRRDRRAELRFGRQRVTTSKSGLDLKISRGSTNQ